MGMLPPQNDLIQVLCYKHAIPPCWSPTAFHLDAFFTRIERFKGSFWARWTAVGGSGNTTSITVTRREQSTMRINSRSSSNLILQFQDTAFNIQTCFEKSKIEQVYYSHLGIEVIISQSFGRKSEVSFFKEL